MISIASLWVAATDASVISQRNNAGLPSGVPSWRAYGSRVMMACSSPNGHLAYLCEVMCYLSACDDVAVVNLVRQSTFFDTSFRPLWPFTRYVRQSNMQQKLTHT